MRTNNNTSTPSLGTDQPNPDPTFHDLQNSYLRLVRALHKFIDYYILIFPNGSSKCQDFQYLKSQILIPILYRLESVIQEKHYDNVYTSQSFFPSMHAEGQQRSEHQHSTQVSLITEEITQESLLLAQLLIFLNFNFKKLVLRNLNVYSIILKDKVLSNDQYAICDELLNDIKRFQILIQIVSEKNQNSSMVTAQIQQTIAEVLHSSFEHNITEFEKSFLKLKPIKGYLIEKYIFNKQFQELKLADNKFTNDDGLVSSITDYSSFLKIMISSNSDDFIDCFRQLKCQNLTKNQSSDNNLFSSLNVGEFDTYINDSHNFDIEEFCKFYQIKSPIDYDYSTSEIIENDFLSSQSTVPTQYGSPIMTSSAILPPMSSFHHLSSSKQLHSHHPHSINASRFASAMKKNKKMAKENSLRIDANYSKSIDSFLKKIEDIVVCLFKFISSVMKLFETDTILVSENNTSQQQLIKVLKHYFSKILHAFESIQEVGKLLNSQDNDDSKLQDITNKFQVSLESFLLNSNYFIHLFNFGFLKSIITNYIIDSSADTYSDVLDLSTKLRFFDYYFFYANMEDVSEQQRFENIKLPTCQSSVERVGSPLIGKQFHQILEGRNKKLLDFCPLKDHFLKHYSLGPSEFSTICLKLQNFINYLCYSILLKNNSFGNEKADKEIEKLSDYGNNIDALKYFDDFYHVLYGANIQDISKLQKKGEKNIGSFALTNNVNFLHSLSISVSDLNLIQVLSNNLLSNDKSFGKISSLYNISDDELRIPQIKKMKI